MFYRVIREFLASDSEVVNCNSADTAKRVCVCLAPFARKMGGSYCATIYRVSRRTGRGAELARIRVCLGEVVEDTVSLVDAVSDQLHNRRGELDVCRLDCSQIIPADDIGQDQALA